MTTRKIWTMDAYDWQFLEEDTRYDTGKWLKHRNVDIEFCDKDNGGYYVKITIYDANGGTIWEQINLQDDVIAKTHINPNYFGLIANGDVCGYLAKELLFKLLIEKIFSNENYAKYFPHLSSLYGCKRQIPSEVDEV